MGEHVIQRPANEAEARAFSRAVIEDVRALEDLIARDGIETGITRMGVEQEMYLVDADARPVPCAEQVLATMNDPRCTTELARFNLEANLPPQLLQGNFLRDLEQQLGEILTQVESAAAQHGAGVLLTGIVPTLEQRDLQLHNLTPILRYQALNDAIFAGRDGNRVLIDGIDHYDGEHDSVMLEAANTSLQLHLQVTPENAAGRYNLMQLITAPLLAAAVNSPVLLGQRVWHETRIAVFERSLDARTGAQLTRDYPTRVCFGDSWVEESLVELFRDSVMRFPVFLTRELEEDSRAVVAAGGAPKLAALSLLNGTVWRWNRPCYGVVDGVAHLRIENRVLPGGPTVLDEVANAALFYGMMADLEEAYGDVTTRLPFEAVRENFVTAARLGLDAELQWVDGRRIAVRDLLLEELLPAARRGLASLAVPADQINRYLGVVEARVRARRTGAAWVLESLRAHPDVPRRHMCASVARRMLANYRSQAPVHEWPLADPVSDNGPTGTADTAKASVASIMTRNLFTLRPDDVIDLADGVIEWRRVRHVPVETGGGELVGLVTARSLLAARARQGTSDSATPTAVESVMQTNHLTVSPDLPVSEAVHQLLRSPHGALLVVGEDGRLEGIVTEHDVLQHFASALA